MNSKCDYGSHELLDRVRIIADMIRNLLVDNKSATESEKLVIDDVANNLEDLYQSIGARHLDDGKTYS